MRSGLIPSAKRLPGQGDFPAITLRSQKVEVRIKHHWTERIILSREQDFAVFT
jgi:hypothetical protein